MLPLAEEICSPFSFYLINIARYSVAVHAEGVSFAPAAAAAITLGAKGRRPNGCHTPLCREAAGPFGNTAVQPSTSSHAKKKPTSIAGGSSYAAQRAYPNRGA